ncbi:hypothetical protein Pcar_3388 [Syntrophotalea carbinolica DSM 2380]|uniref:Uncharacterized protein n=1 Tax=Syntrophotalea carbinolica (strain DSM 2380 / NBRC 103641 / GraBd1) TaxID=338963 RepID=Q0C6D5_SYNC1|nr:hypothetical protein Pcar_3388 [Syntrophotalea carbinolica DSM 2380]
MGKGNALADKDQNGAEGLALSALFTYNITPLCFGKCCKSRPIGLYQFLRFTAEGIFCKRFKVVALPRP